MDTEIKAKDVVEIFIMGEKCNVKVFSTDSKYVYFVDPVYKGIKDLEHRLFRRSKSFDNIRLVKSFNSK